jgi:peptidoglycan/xylan/chitin deacetylase (PgdA/CDA1 family)
MLLLLLIFSSGGNLNADIGPNLISNPSVESVDSNSSPVGWVKGGYGNNSRSFAYPVSGANGTSKAIKLTVSNYVSGDVKWVFSDVPVKPGETYQYSDYYISDTQSILTVRFKTSSGAFIYRDVSTLPISSRSYQYSKAEFTVPQDIVSLTVFHLINSNGNLTIDDASLNKITVDNPGPANLVSNGNLESNSPSNLPANWIKGGWGNNDRSLTYGAFGTGNSKAVQVSITSYSTGDTKWYFTPISTSIMVPGVYTYSDDYRSDVPTTVTVQYQNSDGSFVYKDLANLPASSNYNLGEFSSFTKDFSVPGGVSNVTVFHLLKSTGTLVIDNVGVYKKSDPVGIFKTGAVTLRFDDGWLSQYQNAIPKLNSLGFKGTFYIVTKQMADQGFPGYMSMTQVKSLYNSGHEIGAHTRNHPHLSTLSFADQQNEIVGSRQDLLSQNVGTINSFAYPFGDYDSNTLSIVQGAGFTNASASLGGFVNPTSNKYLLERQEVTNSVTLDQMKAWIDQALANKQWLTITFHEVNNSGNLYSITPENFNALMDYIKLKGIPVIPISQGISSMN